jgi:hypothetical protein
MIRKFKNLERGFFSIQFLFFVSLISVTLLSYGYVFYAQKQKDQFRKACYFDLVDIQKNMVASEKQLFLLNPESTVLRVRLNILYLELAAATAAQNYPLVAQLGLDIQNTISLQKKLDSLQKLIIQKANYTAQFQLMKLNTELLRAYQMEKRIWISLVQENRRYDLKLNPVIAVRPDSMGGLAPNYELQDHYQLLQELQLQLQYQFTNQRDGQSLLQTKQSFQLSCRVSFIKKDQRWDLKINQDKLLSKL